MYSIRNDHQPKIQCTCCTSANVSSKDQNKYPIIDITRAFYKHLHTDNTKEEKDEDIQTQVHNACHDLGCFYIKIRLENDTLPVKSKDSTVLLQYLGTLFDSAWIQQCLDRKEQNPHENDQPQEPQLKTGGTFSFPGTDTTPTVTATFRGRFAESGSSDSSHHTSRSDPTSLHNHNTQWKAEPKQSWELTRCQPCAYSCTERLEKKNSAATTNPFQITLEWMSFFHSVANTLLSPPILNVPLHTLIESRPCTCMTTCTGPCVQCSSKMNTDSSQQPCTMDLLRIFRYDALSTPEEQIRNLGSSPHTDWGSLTIVWQDDKGGLQIYCHVHECWNDVVVPTVSNDTLDTFLFIHVGDFFSLAMNHAHPSLRPYSRMDSSSCPWPSPTHRVVCPLRFLTPTKDRNTTRPSSRPAEMEENTMEQRKDSCNPWMKEKKNDKDETMYNGEDDYHANDDEEESQVRYSLVYFVYPPIGISLADAEQKLSNSFSSCDHMNTKTTATSSNSSSLHTKHTTVLEEYENEAHDGERRKDEMSFPYERYMVLKDQSRVNDTNQEIQQNSSKDENEKHCSNVKDHDITRKIEREQARQVYETIRSYPFHQVIQEKWNQVQRNG